MKTQADYDGQVFRYLSAYIHVKNTTPYKAGNEIREMLKTRKGRNELERILEQYIMEE